MLRRAIAAAILLAPSAAHAYSSRHDQPEPGCGSAMVAILIVALIFSVGAVLDAREARNRPRPTVPDRCDVTVLRIAIDGRARRFMQKELARIASNANLLGREGRLAHLREVSALLRRVRDAWVYGGVVNEPMRDRPQALVAFKEHVREARDKSHAKGPGAHEGDDVLLVSIIVAARTELFTVTTIDAENLRQALEAAPHREPSDLVAVEIVWMPSEDGDRVSTVELEAKYQWPALVPLWSSRIGKVFCLHCSGPFPAELVSCPHCAMPVHLR